MKSLRQIGQPTPWEHCGLSRSEYLARAPWKAARMKRDVFEELLFLRPPEVFTELKRSADAERLIAAALGEGTL